MFLLTVWQPREVWQYARSNDREATLEQHRRYYSTKEIARAWAPWLILSLCVFLWGLPPVRTVFDGGKHELAQRWFERPNFLSGISERKWKVPYLDQLIKPDAQVIGGEGIPKAAEFRFNWLSATGTGIFVAAVLSAFLDGDEPLPIWWIVSADDLSTALVPDHDRLHAGDCLRHAVQR
jgi:L-lactate permease